MPSLDARSLERDNRADLSPVSARRIHSRKMRVSPKVNYEELARTTDEFNGAQLKVSSVI